MYDFSVPMALVDYFPVACFTVAAIFMQRDLYHMMYKGQYALLAAGTINIIAAGFLKATWKLLYAAGICDFRVLSTLFLPMQSLGFLLAGLAMVSLITRRKSRAAVLAVAPPVFAGTMVFILMMVLGLAGMCAGLCVVAARMKKKALMVFFIVSFICSMVMGRMASMDSASAAVNWMEQFINCIGQGMMMAGMILLHKSGLKEFAN